MAFRAEVRDHRAVPARNGEPQRSGGYQKASRTFTRPNRDTTPTRGSRRSTARRGWRTAGTDASALLDFLGKFGTSDDVVCYARCVVVAPEDMDVVMGLGSNDGARVWVNGDMVFDLHAGRRASQNDDRVPVHLRRGENEVLVKVGKPRRGLGPVPLVRGPRPASEVPSRVAVHPAFARPGEGLSLILVTQPRLEPVRHVVGTGRRAEGGRP